MPSDASGIRARAVSLASSRRANSSSEHTKRRCAAPGGAADPGGHLGEVGVPAAVRVVVHVVELADTREAALEHLDEGLRGDRFELLGAQVLEECVQALAPGPEAVGRRAAQLGQPRERALEAVAVAIAQARHGEDVPLGRAGVGHAGIDRHDAAGRDAHAHVAGPAGREQRLPEMQLLRRALRGGVRHVRPVGSASLRRGAKA
jgi:hypothetical protein